MNEKKKTNEHKKLNNSNACLRSVMTDEDSDAILAPL